MNQVLSTFALLVTLGFFVNISNARGVAGNIKLISMKSNQYWFSTTSPYAPVLNYHLAYQYCRNLGLQLVGFETQEEINDVALFLTTSYEGNSGSNERDFWTSGNKLGGNDVWLWMSNGDQLNSSFVQEHGLHRQGPPTSPRNCLSLKSMSTRRTVFTPEVCDRALPFICEQIRCLSYYYPSVEFPGPTGSAPNSAEFMIGLQSESSEVPIEMSSPASASTEMLIETR